VTGRVHSGPIGGSDVDERRFDELKEKRRSKGLTDEEADELGKMLAEQAGKPYSNARHLPPEEEKGAGGSSNVDPGTAGS
jgi:hypothetical protein